MPETETKRVKGIDIEEDIHFQEQEWKTERAGWIIGLALLIAALAGLFGHGPLSKQTVRSGSFELNYDQFIRYLAPTTISVSMQPTQVVDDKIAIWVERRLLERYEIDNIYPQPERTRLSQDRIVYEFLVEQADQPITISFYLQTNQIGFAQGQVGEEGTERVLALRQFVYP